MIITLDGPSGSGKSTIAARLAHHLKIPNLDTGATYRCLAWLATKESISLEDEDALVALSMRLDFDFGFEGSEPYSAYSLDAGVFHKLGKEIRNNEISMAASKIAKLKNVRSHLVDLQRRIGARKGGVVEGRDAGTVIFSDAPLKFYMTASVEARARRRYEELLAKLGDQAPSFKDVHDEMIKRDDQDSSRMESPLKPAQDAIWVDTTDMDLGQVFERVLRDIERLRT